MSMLLALDNGYQACMMAPTEILQYHSAVTNSKVKEWFRPYSNPRLQFAVCRLRPHESTSHYHEDLSLIHI